MKQLFIAILLLAGPFANAGGTPYADKDFMEIAAWINGIDKYSYELIIHSEMKDNPKDKQYERSVIYSSNADFILFIKGENESSFMRRQGMFKVHSRSKEIIYKQFESEAVTRRAIAAAGVNDPGRLLDSVLF